MRVSYCRRWNFLHHQPIDPLTEQQARRRDEKGELYTAVLGDPDDPVILVEVERPDIRVTFLDRLRRQSNHFDFRRHDDDTLFLHQIVNWTYPDDQARLFSEASMIKDARYELPDVVHLVIRDLVTGEYKRTSYREVNFDINWEPVPAFGDWLSIARFDRDKPVEEQYFAEMLGDERGSRWRRGG